MTAETAVLWRDAPLPSPALRMVVVVPVRNEVERLTDTLQSLLAQRDMSGLPLHPTSFEVLLLANNCSDGSAALARAFAAAHGGLALHVQELELPPADAHIGHVRKLLMDAACRRLATADPAGSGATASAAYAGGGVVASTDGDTVVHPLWLAHIQREFEAGVDAVGGRILLDPRFPLPARTLRRHRCDTAYRLALERLEDLLDPDPVDPWPRHHQHFCASLAVSRRAYERVGGVPAVRYLEDVALVAALRTADLRIRHSPQVRVFTSPRVEGRVEVGLSWQLRQWSDGGGGDPGAHSSDSGALLVDDPAALAARWQARGRLRVAWQSRSAEALRTQTAALAADLGLPTAALLNSAQTAPSFGHLWADVQARAAGPDRVPVRVAIHRLRGLMGR